MDLRTYDSKVKELAATLKSRGIVASESMAIEMARDIIKTEQEQLKSFSEKQFDPAVNPQQKKQIAPAKTSNVNSSFSAAKGSDDALAKTSPAPVSVEGVDPSTTLSDVLSGTKTPSFTVKPKNDSFDFDSEKQDSSSDDSNAKPSTDSPKKPQITAMPADNVTVSKNSSSGVALSSDNDHLISVGASSANSRAPADNDLSGAVSGFSSDNKNPLPDAGADRPHNTPAVPAAHEAVAAGADSSSKSDAPNTDEEKPQEKSKDPAKEHNIDISEMFNFSKRK